MHDFSYRLIVTLLLAAGLSAFGFASAEPSDATIEAAQKEFKSLMIDPHLSGDTKLELPSINSPVTPSNNLLPGSSSQIRRPTLREKQKAARSKNWLLEAMLKDTSEADGEDSLEEEQAKLTQDPFEQMLTEHLQAKENEDRKNDEEAKTNALKAETINPLSSFMVGWISERDRGVLLPDTQESTADFSAPNTEVASASIPNLDFAQPMSGLARVKTEQLFTERTVNPYLDRLEKRLVRVPETPSVAIPDSLTPPTQIAPFTPQAPRVLPRNDVTPPEILRKAEQDKKYFPQLKRF